MNLMFPSGTPTATVMSEETRKIETNTKDEIPILEGVEWSSEQPAEFESEPRSAEGPHTGQELDCIATYGIHTLEVRPGLRSIS